ncbi:MAG: hypothetical protein ACO3ZG_06640 [Kiritimatiellia bacterium]
MRKNGLFSALVFDDLKKNPGFASLAKGRMAAVDQARREVSRFVRDPASLEVWSRDFFRQIIGRIRFV